MHEKIFPRLFGMDLYNGHIQHCDFSGRPHFHGTMKCNDADNWDLVYNNIDNTEMLKRIMGTLSSCLSCYNPYTENSKKPKDNKDDEGFTDKECTKEFKAYIKDILDLFIENHHEHYDSSSHYDVDYFILMRLVMAYQRHTKCNLKCLSRKLAREVEKMKSKTRAQKNIQTIKIIENCTKKKV